MNKTTLMLVVAGLSSTISTMAQGTVNFVTRISGLLDAPLTDAGTRVGSGYRATLYWGLTQNQLAPAYIIKGGIQEYLAEPFYQESGYVIAGKRIIAGAAEGSLVYMQLRVWPASGGSTYEAAATAGNRVAQSNVFPVTLGGDHIIPPQVPGNLVGLTTLELPPPLDWGDAPDPYPTMGQLGARHLVLPDEPILGVLVDVEPNGQQDPFAMGDDLNPLGLCDEDGVEFLWPLVAGHLSLAKIVAPRGGILNAWMDFEADFSWDQPGNEIAPNWLLNPGANFLSFTVPSTAQRGKTFARFRVSSMGGLPPSGEAPDGEVEDYQVMIHAPTDLDYGDAPAPYPTKLADNGARHLIGPEFCLGQRVDGEGDGQFNASATADDTNPAGSANDEDGVKFIDPLLPGTTVSAEVMLSSAGGKGGLVNAWIDFNGANGWTDPGEQIFKDVPLAPGLNILHFDLPSSAKLGTSYARFRLSSQGGLSYDGPALDGEVEDYQVMIGAQYPVKIISPPQSVTVVEGQLATFNVLVTGAPPYTFKWMRNGMQMPGQTSPTYTIGRVILADDGAEFSVLVTGAQGSPVTSPAATLKVTADTTPPAISSVAGSDTFMAVTVTFSEPVAVQDANVAGNYSIPGLTVIGVIMLSEKEVELTTSQQIPDTEYTLTIANIHDTAANANLIAPPGNTFKFRSLPSVMLGDLNGDGKVTWPDGILSLQIAVGVLLPSPSQKIAGDVNRDKKLNIQDTILILQYAGGLITSFPAAQPAPSLASHAVLFQPGSERLHDYGSLNLSPPSPAFHTVRVQEILRETQGSNEVVEVSIELVAGDPTQVNSVPLGLTFTLNWDTSLLSYQGSQVGIVPIPLPEPLLNTNEVTQGRLALGAATAEGLTDGTLELARLRFIIESKESPDGLATLRFTDEIAPAIVAGFNKNSGKVELIATSFTDGVLRLNPASWFRLTVMVSPPSYGAVSNSPLPILNNLYLAGSQVTLEATPWEPFMFTSWNGDASGTLNPITIKMDRDKFITANFSLPTIDPTIRWINGSGNWNNPANWDKGVLPGPEDHVLIDRPNTNVTVTFSTGSASVKSLRCEEALALSGGSLTVANTVQVNNDFTLSGGTLRSALVLAGANGAGLKCAGGTLDQVSVNGDLDLSGSGASVTMTNGLVLNGTARLGYGSLMNFHGTQTLSGQGAVVFNPTYSYALRLMSPGMTLTIGPQFTIRGGSVNATLPAGIGMTTLYGSASNISLINQGTIVADVNGGILVVDGNNFVNQGTLQALNGGTLRLANFSHNYGTAQALDGTLEIGGQWHNQGTIVVSNGTLNLGGSFDLAKMGTIVRTGGTVKLTGFLDNRSTTLVLNAASGSWQLAGGTIWGGTVTSTDGAQLIGFTKWSKFDGVTANIEVDLSQKESGIIVTNGLVLNSTARLGYGSLIDFYGSQNLSGRGAVVFNPIYSYALRLMSTGMTLTIGPQFTIRGGSVNATLPAGIGMTTLYGSASNVSLINQGTIVADVNGGILVVDGNNFVNQGTLQALNGGTLRLANFSHNYGTAQAIDGTLEIGGQWNNQGTIVVSNGTLNLGGTFDLAKMGTIARTGGTVKLTGFLDNRNTILALNAASGSWQLAGGTIWGGTVAGTDGAQLIGFTKWSKLDGVTANIEVDLSQKESGIIVTNGLVLNGTARLGYGSLIDFYGSQTLAGQGAVVFNPIYSYALRLMSLGMILTIGPQFTIRGGSINATLPAGIGMTTLYGSASNISLINQGTIVADVKGGVLVVDGNNFVNQGTLLASNGAVLRVMRALLNGGAAQVASGGVIDAVGSFQFDGQAWLESQTDGSARFAGNLLANTRNATQYLPRGTVFFNGSGTLAAPQLLEVMGQDLGSNAAGFVGNFVYGTLVISNRTCVKLVDQSDNAPNAEALYVNTLVLGAGTTLDLNGLHVYTREMEIGGQVLNGSITRVMDSGTNAPPTLNVGRQAGQLVFSWRVIAAGCIIETTEILSPSSPWLPLDVTPTIEGDLMSLSVPLRDRQRYYRLKVQ